MSWATLSVDIWTKILQFLPPDCLGPCSTVSKTLQHAAAAATTEVFFQQGSAHRLAGLLHWILRYGRHLTSLDLRLPAGTFPCSVQPGVNKIACVLDSCTQLRKLTLFLQSVGSFAGVWAALSTLAELQQLDLAVGGAQQQPDHRMPSTVLQHLQPLTQLQLCDTTGCLFDTHSLQHISCLTNLQSLRIAHHEGVALCSSSTPGINRLTALQGIYLHSVSLDPAILQDCRQLQSLALIRVSIINDDDAACLLSLAGRLPQLLQVEFTELEYHWPIAAAAYTSLTASSKLERLAIDIEGLPPGVWQFLFPAGGQWPALQCLTSAESEPALPPPAAALGTDDLSRLVGCCPGLQHVAISLQPGAQLAPLAQLSALTCLIAVNADAGAFESFGALTGLLTLRALLVNTPEVLVPQSLLRFTAMTGLTALRITSAPEEEGVYDVDLVQVCQTKCLCNPCIPIPADSAVGSARHSVPCACPGVSRDVSIELVRSGAAQNPTLPQYKETHVTFAPVQRNSRNMKDMHSKAELHRA